MRKYTKAESVEVLDKTKTDVIQSTLQKTSKVSVADLNETEMDILRADLADTENQD